MQVPSSGARAATAVRVSPPGARSPEANAAAGGGHTGAQQAETLPPQPPTSVPTDTPGLLRPHAQPSTPRGTKRTPGVAWPEPGQQCERAPRAVLEARQMGTSLQTLPTAGDPPPRIRGAPPGWVLVVEPLNPGPPSSCSGRAAGPSPPGGLLSPGRKGGRAALPAALRGPGQSSGLTAVPAAPGRAASEFELGPFPLESLGHSGPSFRGGWEGTSRGGRGGAGQVYQQQLGFAPEGNEDSPMSGVYRTVCIFQTEQGILNIY